MMPVRKRNLVAAALILAGAVYFVVEADSFRPLSRLFPRVVGFGVIGLAGLLGVLSLIGRDPDVQGAGTGAEGRHVRSVTLVLVLTGWTALIPVLGLLISSIVGVLTLGLVMFRRHVASFRSTVVALVAIGLFYALFAIILNVPFPGGVLY